jgi:hypothetical protein
LHFCGTHIKTAKNLKYGIKKVTVSERSAATMVITRLKMGAESKDPEDFHCTGPIQGVRPMLYPRSVWPHAPSPWLRPSRTSPPAPRRNEPSICGIDRVGKKDQREWLNFYGIRVIDFRDLKVQLWITMKF